MSENKTGKKPYVKPILIIEDYTLRELSGSPEMIEQLKTECREMDAAKEEWNDRRILISKAGSIAEASVQINRLMETAQATADQYVENIKQEYTERILKEYADLQRRMAGLEQTTKRQCAQLLQEAKGKAEDYGGGA